MVATRLKFAKFVILSFLLLTLTLAACGTPTPPPVQVAPTATPVATAVPTTAPATNTPLPQPTSTVVSLPTVTVAPNPTTAPATTAAPDPTTAAPAATGSAPTTAAPAATGSAPTAPASTGKLWLAYVDDSSLKIMTADGQEQKVLLDAIGKLGVDGRPDWSPDNTKIAFAAVTEKAGAAGIYVMDLQGQNKKMLAGQPANTSDVSPRWSHDGQFIAFTRIIDANANRIFEEADPHEVWVMEKDGKNARKVGDGRQPAWAPNNLRLVFVTNGTLKDDRLQNNALNMVNAQGQNKWEPFNVAKVPNDLSNLGFPMGVTPEYLQSPTWLDNGRTLGFVVRGFSGLIVTVNASNGGDPKFWDTAFDASFGTADGASRNTTLVYQGWLASGVPTVHIQNIAGKPDLTKPASVVAGGPRQQKFALFPAVAPDGVYVAYSKGSVAGDFGGFETNTPEGSLIIAQYRNGQLQEKEVAKGRISALAWSK